MHHKKIQSSKKGLTLSELLVASAVLAFAIAGLLLGFSYCAVLNEGNRNITTAVSHSDYVMEEIRQTDFATIVGTYNGAAWDSQAITNLGLQALDNEIITISVTGTTLLNVRVTVLWQERNSRTRNIAIGTLISQP